MATAVTGLHPEPVWRYFARISRIPRGSKNEAAVTRYILDTASRLRLAARTDATGNVVVRKPASRGREHVRPVAVQGHLDMVCEKNRGRRHDFSKDPIRLLRRGDILKADGTTLGADNGIALAASLAIMENGSLEHGPLEFLFTVDEETGMTGAMGLTPDFLESRVLVNLDSEQEGTVYIGCAGGTDTIGTWKVPGENAPARCIPERLKVTNLRGGHSGLDINRGRGNAVKIAGRFLNALDPVGIRLARIDGGSKHNAIPRECESLFYLPANRVEEAEGILGGLYDAIGRELAAADPDLKIDFVADFGGDGDGKVMRKAFQRRILRAMAAIPHGVITMSPDIAGLVQTSTNVAVVRSGNDGLSIATSQRSAVASELAEVTGAVSAVFALAGASVRYSDGYPGWMPDRKSALLKTARGAYRSLFGRPVRVRAIHAGLECGVIAQRIPGMDMISFGPTIEGAHSPDERIHIPSVDRFWRFLLALLQGVR